MALKHAGKIGLGLMVLSCIIYAGFLTIPFLPLSAQGKVATGTGIFIAGEAAFWIGCLIVGKEVMTKYRHQMNPFNWIQKWRNKK